MVFVSPYSSLGGILVVVNVKEYGSFGILPVGGLSPQAAVLEHDLLSVDVVAKPKTTKGEPPLAFPKWYRFELSDVVPPGAVGGIGL
jgi:hypothetical protein